jgi:hypothetical protein
VSSDHNFEAFKGNNLVPGTASYNFFSVLNQLRQNGPNFEEKWSDWCGKFWNEGYSDEGQFAKAMVKLADLMRFEQAGDLAEPEFKKTVEGFKKRWMGDAVADFESDSVTGEDQGSQGGGSVVAGGAEGKKDNFGLGDNDVKKINLKSWLETIYGGNLEINEILNLSEYAMHQVDLEKVFGINQDVFLDFLKGFKCFSSFENDIFLDLLQRMYDRNKFHGQKDQLPDLSRSKVSSGTIKIGIHCWSDRFLQNFNQTFYNKLTLGQLEKLGARIPELAETRAYIESQFLKKFPEFAKIDSRPDKLAQWTEIFNWSDAHRTHYRQFRSVLRAKLLQTKLDAGQPDCSMFLEFLQNIPNSGLDMAKILRMNIEESLTGDESHRLVDMRSFPVSGDSLHPLLYAINYNS